MTLEVDSVKLGVGPSRFESERREACAALPLAENPAIDRKYGRSSPVQSGTHHVRPAPAGRLTSFHEKRARLATAAAERLAHTQAASSFKQPVITQWCGA
jgi:hypothetical protein